MAVQRTNKVHLIVHPQFYSKMDAQRRTLQNKIGVKDLGWCQFTELASKGELRLPNINWRKIYGTKKR